MRGGTETVHATAIALCGATSSDGALIRGPSGAGKSDLALRCIATAPSPLVAWECWLIADDRTTLTRSGDDIRMTAPAAIAGQIEVRSIGILAVPYAPAARLVLVVDLLPASTPIERMPEPGTVTLLERPIPRLFLHPFEHSAHLKLLLALCAAAHPTTPTRGISC